MKNKTTPNQRIGKHKMGRRHMITKGRQTILEKLQRWAANCKAVNEAKRAAFLNSRGLS